MDDLGPLPSDYEIIGMGPGRMVVDERTIYGLAYFGPARRCFDGKIVWFHRDGSVIESVAEELERQGR